MKATTSGKRVQSHDTINYHYGKHIFILLKPGHYDILYESYEVAKNKVLLRAEDEYLGRVFSKVKLKMSYSGKKTKILT